ncbi:MAG: hypothetical protein M3082_02525 [Candidatus Dormibacteraeota bacterium]|nr:hypothetical protein [Candidatus Dormibacteraeota bacterium]
MEARRTFQTEAKSTNQIWMVLAALLAVVVLGVGSAFLANALTTASAPSSTLVVQSGGFQGSHHAPIRNAPASTQRTAPDPSANSVRYR